MLQKNRYYLLITQIIRNEDLDGYTNNIIKMIDSWPYTMILKSVLAVKPVKKNLKKKLENIRKYLPCLI